MKIKEVTPKDLYELSELEQEVFGEDAFTEKLIKKLIRRNTFFFKMKKSSIKGEIIAFVIVIKDRQDRTNIINFLVKPKFHIITDFRGILTVI